MPLSSYHRRGLATLEMALSMPILVLMIALIMLTADGMVLTSQIAIEARANAMNQALKHKSADGFDRFLLEDVATSDRYTRDIIRGSASRSDAAVRVFPSSQISAASQLSVLRNTWSHTELPLSDDNRLKLYGELVLAGSAGKLTSVIDQLRGLGSSVASTVEGLGQASQATQEDPPGLEDAQEARRGSPKARAREATDSRGSASPRRRDSTNQPRDRSAQ